MDVPTKKEPWPFALRLGFVLTALWLIVFVKYLSFSWDTLVSSPPNAVGDFLAGWCAPLAFLWLTVAVFLQKEELAAQRHELEMTRKALLLQADELKRSVEQQGIIAEVQTRAQVQRGRQEIDQELEEKINLLAFNLRHWAKECSVRFGAEQNPIHYLFADPRALQTIGADDLRAFFLHVKGTVRASEKQLAPTDIRVFAKSSVFKRVSEIQSDVQGLLEKVDAQGSSVLSEKAEKFGLRALDALLKTVLSLKVEH